MDGRGFFAKTRDALLPSRNHADRIDKGNEPFDDDGISLQQQAQRLGEIPSVDIEVAFERQLDDVARWPWLDVLGGTPHKDETTIVITVGR